MVINAKRLLCCAWGKSSCLEKSLSFYEHTFQLCIATKCKFKHLCCICLLKNSALKVGYYLCSLALKMKCEVSTMLSLPKSSFFQFFLWISKIISPLLSGGVCACFMVAVTDFKTQYI